MLYCHTTSKFYCPLGLIMGRFPSDFLMCGHPPSSKPQWQLDPLIFSGLEFFKTFFQFQNSKGSANLLSSCLVHLRVSYSRHISIFVGQKVFVFGRQKNCWNFAPICWWTKRKCWHFAPIYSTWAICVTSHQSWFPNSQELCSKWGDYKEGTFKEMELSNFFCQAVCNILVKL